MDKKKFLSLLEKLNEIDDQDSGRDKEITSALEEKSELVGSGDFLVPKTDDLKRLQEEKADGHKKEILKYLRKTSDYSLFLFFLFAIIQAFSRIFIDRHYTIFEGNGMDILITVAFVHTIGVISVISYQLWKK